MEKNWFASNGNGDGDDIINSISSARSGNNVYDGIDYSDSNDNNNNNNNNDDDDKQKPKQLPRVAPPSPLSPVVLPQNQTELDKLLLLEVDDEDCPTNNGSKDAAMNNNSMDTATSTASYVSQDVRIEPATTLEIPIPIFVPGSIVKWKVDVAQWDIVFGIRMQQNVVVRVGTETENTEPEIHWIVEKQTIVHHNDDNDDDDEKGRATLSDGGNNVNLVAPPVTGEFIAGGANSGASGVGEDASAVVVDGVVDTFVLEFDNVHSWMTEKMVSYSVTVSPPPIDSTLIERSKQVSETHHRIQTIQELSVFENNMETLIVTTPIKAKPQRKTKKREATIRPMVDNHSTTHTTVCPTNKHDGKSSSDNAITTISNSISSTSTSTSSTNDKGKDAIVHGIKEQQVQEVIQVVRAPPVGDTLILTTPIKTKPQRKTNKKEATVRTMADTNSTTSIPSPTKKHDGKIYYAMTTISSSSSSSSNNNDKDKDAIVIGIKEQQVQEVRQVVRAPPVKEEEEEEKLIGKPIIVIVGATSKFTLINPVPVTKQQQKEETDGSDRDEKGDTNSDNDVPKWGLGGALAVPFAKRGYNIVLMGRRMDILQDVQHSVELVHQKWWRNKHEIKKKNKNCNLDADDEKRQQQQEQHFPNVLSVLCDVTDDKSVQQAFQEVSDNIGGNNSNSNSNGIRLFPTNSYIDLVIYNVAPPYPPGFKFEHWGDVLQPHQIDTTNMSFQLDTLVNGLIRVCKQSTVIPDMIQRHKGCILVSGESCCNLSGGYEFGGVAPGRAAVRSLTQSMFRAYGPQGIHVCNINIGGIIDTPRTRTWSASMPKLTNPYEIAKQYWMVYQQPSTVWSYELQLCPSFSAREVDMRM